MCYRHYKGGEKVMNRVIVAIGQLLEISNLFLNKHMMLFPEFTYLQFFAGFFYMYFIFVLWRKIIDG